MKSRLHLALALWFPGLAVVMLLLAGCTVAQPGASSQPKGLHIQGDTLTGDWTDPQIMCRGASLVADSGIAGLGASHWNTPDGTRSASLDTGTILKDGYAIYTPIHLSNVQIHRDQRHQPTSEFDTIGGQVGPDSFSEGFPQVAPGGRYWLVFVPGIDPVAKAYTEKWLTVAAAWPIDKGMVILRPQTVEQGTTFPEVTKPLSQMVQQLANCK